jgi:hypothetical protein
MILVELDCTLLTNGYITYIVSYKSSQTFKFVHLKTFFEPYAPQIWTKFYVYHNIREYEVTLAIVMEKYFSTL